MKPIPVFDYLEDYTANRGEILGAIERVLASGSLILGPEGDALEREFAAWLGGGHAVAVGSGTDALIVALMAAGVGRGDEVITVSFTATATVSAIRSVGAIPVFCDADAATGLMDTSAVQSLLSARTRAVIPVHLYGNMVDVTALRTTLGGRDVTVIEDCAQAHGGRLRDMPAGTFGDIAAFSFYPTKNLGALGDGGMCLTRDPAMAAEMRRVRMYGFEGAIPPALREGINSRLDELQAAVLRLRLPQLDAAVTRRRELATRYDDRLRHRVERLVAGDGVMHARHLYVVSVPRRDQVRDELARRAIQCGVHYPHPVHLMPGYRFLGYGPGDLPVTEQLAASVLSLPMFPALGFDAVDRVCAELLDVVD